MKIRLGYVAISNALGKKVTSSSNVTYKTYSKITSEEKKIEKLERENEQLKEESAKITERKNFSNDPKWRVLKAAGENKKTK